MVQKLEAIKGGGGSIKVGTKGTISSLMTRELDSVKPAPKTPVSFRHKSQTIPTSVACGSPTPKRLQLRKSLDGASTSGNDNNYISYKHHQTSQKTKSLSKSTHQIPMLGFENIALDRTPSRQKSDKKVSNIVEVVDIKCGKYPDRAWSNPVTNRLKKLGFSKLSQSISRPATCSHQISGSYN
ncbi:hypothetical protein ERO13_D01G065000v2 [Gossypium hirsutum]|uniref:Uncharacterized protein n=2 Tax=Gossypium TaxID=3633 RepID=A0ABM2ZJW1_GOSHI|nr:uncharacterized protein LOC121203521 [Gossypium hirsutum]TYH87027.1 hypothetical protein ES332_D01G086500v1 [Gossypium tomentosum]KAG4161587.1 hypothetical protein ERO13_D01G065000v2 [Gossypium hirsutum]KAG4161588.1 hypothetical protein ERO13_D01G065000v2 [Gossypium hirsutum]TYH87028.1 hypothetical protein ES332_D01G086500v1 [Gossypium tomentosum]TYH87029.1 hypothetical protein ES332_D01G086500v1 [Gossypium tomentosum]